MNNSDWKKQLRQSLEYAKQGKVKLEFNANFYNYLQLLRRQKRVSIAAVACESQIKPVGNRF